MRYTQSYKPLHKSILTKRILKAAKKKAKEEYHGYTRHISEAEFMDSIVASNVKKSPPKPKPKPKPKISDEEFEDLRDKLL